MISFFELPTIIQSVVLVLYTLLGVVELYCIISGLIDKTEKKTLGLTVMLFVFSCLNLMILIEGFRYNEKYYGMMHTYMAKIIESLSPEIVLIVLAVQIVAVCFNVVKVIRWRKTNITPMSIKQGADKLPTGLCCYDEDGRPKLVNYSMDRLCRSLTGEPLLNADEFWQKLTEGKVEPGNTVIRTGDVPMILLESGEVRSFTRTQIISGKKTVFELSAAEITEQYQLSSRLMEYNAELEQVKNRLVQYSENVADITREKEILSAKVRIHDRLGNALLAARRYIETGDEAVSRETLLKLWQRNISLLQREAEQPSESGTLDGLYEAAQIMGITVHVIGDLPKDDNRTMRFLMSGARECLTNAVHHAKAAKLNVCISAENDYNVIEYTNDGIPPEDEIIEGGGLSSLRKSVEAEGGIMQVSCLPQFVLTLKIPKSGVLM